MGKRSNFQRMKGDFYETPSDAVWPLVPHLSGQRYIEPCAGAGALIWHLRHHDMVCVRAFDIEPRLPEIERKDATTLTEHDVRDADLIITNPPWTRHILHGLIDHLTTFGLPVWLLFDADWKHTVQAARFEPMLRDIVSVGRVKWIPGSKNTGMDNAAWYQFGPPKNDLPRFRMRRAA